MPGTKWQYSVVEQYESWPALKPKPEDAAIFTRQIDHENKLRRPNQKTIEMLGRDRAIALKSAK